MGFFDWKTSGKLAASCPLSVAIGIAALHGPQSWGYLAWVVVGGLLWGLLSLPFLAFWLADQFRRRR